MTKQQKEKLANKIAKKFRVNVFETREAMQAYHEEAKKLEYKENCRVLKKQF